MVGDISALVDRLETNINPSELFSPQLIFVFLTGEWNAALLPFSLAMATRPHNC